MNTTQTLLTQLCPPRLLIILLVCGALAAFVPLLACRLVYLIWKDGVSL